MLYVSCLLLALSLVAGQSYYERRSYSQQGPQYEDRPSTGTAIDYGQIRRLIRTELDTFRNESPAYEALSRDVQELGRKVDQMMLRQPANLEQQLERKFETWMQEMERRMEGGSSCEGLDRSVEELKRKLDYIQQLLQHRQEAQVDNRLGGATVIRHDTYDYRRLNNDLQGRGDASNVNNVNRYNVDVSKDDILQPGKTNHASAETKPDRTSDFRFRWEDKVETPVMATTVTPRWRQLRTVATAPPPRQPPPQPYVNPDVRANHTSASHSGSQNVEISISRSDYNFRYPEYIDGAAATEKPADTQEVATQRPQPSTHYDERRADTDNRHESGYRHETGSETSRHSHSTRYENRRADTDNRHESGHQTGSDAGRQETNRQETSRYESSRRSESHRQTNEQETGREVVTQRPGYVPPTQRPYPDIPTERSVSAANYNFRYTHIQPTVKPPSRGYERHHGSVRQEDEVTLRPYHGLEVITPRPYYETIDGFATPRARGSYHFRYTDYINPTPHSDDEATSPTPRTARWYNNWVRYGARSSERQSNERVNEHHVLSDEEADFDPTAKYGKAGNVRLYLRTELIPGHLLK